MKEWMWRIGCGPGFGWEEFWCPDVVPVELEALWMLVVWWFVCSHGPRRVYEFSDV